MAFLHGVETTQISKGANPISVVKTGVVGLVGIAPKGGSKSSAVLVLNDRDTTFGSEVPGFTIPQALTAIFKQGAGQVLVVNVFDEAAHTTTNTDVSQTVGTDGKITLSTAPVGNITAGQLVTVKNNAGSTTYVNGTHYTVTDFGVITIIDSTAIPNGTVLKVSWKQLTIANVTATHIIGGTGTKDGTKAWQDSLSTYGMNPKILIAPGFLALTGVAAELIALADLYRGVCILDAPVGTSVTTATAARGSGGSILGWQTSSKRCILAYPQMKALSPATNADENRPFSQFLAGVICAQDNEKGYWWSPSNREIKGITGVEKQISAQLNSSSSEANALNSNGITTYFNSFGTGYRVWGNRSAGYPSASDALTFIPVQRTMDIIHKSVENAMLAFIDRPITQATIDAIRDTVNAFLRLLVARDAIIDGVCKFTASKNPSTEIALGHLTFDIEFMPPVPAERISFESFINTDFLKSLK